MFTIFLALFTVCVVDATPIPVILDTDIGTDFDDTWALHYLLSRRDLFDLKMVQVSTFNTSQRAQVAAKILATLGRYDVPIGLGRNTGEQNMPQYGYAQNYTLAMFTAAGGTVYDGTSYLSQLMLASDPHNPTYLIEISPATSVADVLRANNPPRVSENVILVAMSGSIYHGYFNSSTPAAEYNVVIDIAASQLMYSAAWLSPMVTAPLDTTVFDQFCNAEYQTLLAANDTDHPIVFSLLANYVYWYNAGGHASAGMKPFTPATGTSTLYDLQAVYMAAHYRDVNSFPHFTVHALPVSVDSKGFTRVTPGARTVWAAVGFPPVGAGPSVDAFAADVVSSLIVG